MSTLAFILSIIAQAAFAGVVSIVGIFAAASIANKYGDVTNTTLCFLFSPAIASLVVSAIFLASFAGWIKIVPSLWLNVAPLISAIIVVIAFASSGEPKQALAWEWPAKRAPASSVRVRVDAVSEIKSNWFGIPTHPSSHAAIPDPVVVAFSVDEPVSNKVYPAFNTIVIPRVEAIDLAAGRHAYLYLASQSRAVGIRHDDSQSSHD